MSQPFRVHNSDPDELQHRLTMERLISSLATRFITDTGAEVGAQIEAGLKSVAEFVGCEASLLMFINPDSNMIDQVFEWRSLGLERQQHRILQAQAHDWLGFLDQVKAGQVIEIPDIFLLPEAGANGMIFNQNDGIRSVLVVPIRDAERTVCAFSLGNCQTDKNWPETEVQFIRSTGELLSRGAEYLAAQNRLRASELEKALVLNAVEELIVHVDTDLKIRSLNKSASAAAGVENGALVGRFCYEIWHDRQAPCNECPVEKAIQLGIPQTAEIISPDGRVWRTKGYPVRNDRGEIIGGVDVTLEITDRKQAEQKLQHKIIQQAQLIDATRYLTESLDVKTVLTRIVSGARQIINAYGCTIYLLEHENNRLRPVVAIDPPYEEEILATSLDVDRSFTGQAVKERKSIIFNDPLSQTIGQHIPATPEDDNERLIVAPLIVEEQVQGAMCLNRMGQIFTDDDLKLAEAFAAFASTVLKNAQVYDSLQYEINERRLAESALAESEHNLRMVMDQAPVGIVTLDTGGVVTDINQKGLEILGSPSREATVGLNVLTLPPIVEAGLDRHFKEVLETRQASVLETWYTSLWGKRSFLRSNLVPRINGLGEQIGALQLLEDVTNRKLADERLHLQAKTMEAAANGILIADREGTVVWANPAIEILTGYTPQEVIGQNLMVLSSSKQGDTFFQDFWNTILSGQAWQGEMINRRKDGSSYYEDMTITPVFDDENGFTHLINIKQDITTQKERDIQQEAILNLSEVLRGVATSREMAPIIAQQIVRQMDAEGSAICLCRHSKGKIDVAAMAGSWTGNPDLVSKLVASYIDRAEQLQRPFFLEKSELGKELPGIAPFLAEIPLVTQDDLVGVMWIGRASEFGANDAIVLSSLADLTANALQRATLHEDTQRKVQQLAALHNIDLAINASVDINVTLNLLLSQLLTHLEVDAADILRLDHQTQTLHYLAGRGFRSRGLDKIVIPMGRGVVSMVALDRKRVVIPNLIETQNQFDRNFQKLGENFVFYCAEPLIAKGRLIAVLEVFHRSPFDADSEWLDFLETLAGQAAIAIDNASLFNDLQRTNQELAVAYNTTLEGWARALELRDEATEGHTRRVTDLTVRLARAMGIPDPDLVNIQRGAMLHDIGKMAVPDKILAKPGPLNDEEWEIMRMHPVYARDMLSTIPYLEKAIDIPFYHHERWDGTGYPLGLMGLEIPLPARIFAVVDVWDALRNERVYRPAWPDDEVLTYLKQHAGSHLDPDVVRLFLSLIDDLV